MCKPQDEATNLLKADLDAFCGGNIDLKQTLRRCAHVCQILGWHEQLTWFQNELRGYPNSVELPFYRRGIKGTTRWITTGGLSTTIASVVEDSYATEEKPVMYIEMDIRGGIDWILSAAQSGYIQGTGKKSSRYLSFQKTSIETAEVNDYSADVFQTILTELDNLVFNFVSNSYVILRYGDTLQDVWQAYRTKVEEQMATIGFATKLDTIRNGLNSSNPQDWRAAMWSCRDIFHDLAAYLWRDQRDTYEYLPGKGADGKLRVTESDYLNRLGAYLHQKSIVGEMGAYLRAEMERIYHSIDTLIDLTSKAHSEVPLFTVRTAAIGTYTLLGEIVTRTDMQPVMEYCNPSASGNVEQ